MADRTVIDASAALALILGEDGRERVVDVLAAHPDQSLLVPELFWHEIVNVLLRRHGWEPDAIVGVIRELDELGVETVVLDRPLLLSSLDLASRLGLTAYDAAYLALAEAADADLLTLDEGLAAAAGDRPVIRRRRGVHEERARYGTEASSIDWTRHGTYLAELRLASARDTAHSQARAE